MADKRKVKVTNISNHRVIYAVGVIRREFKPGMKMNIDFDELEQVLYDSGVKGLFSGGLLRCDGLSKDDQITLGLLSDVEESPVRQPVGLSMEEIRGVFATGTPASILKMCKDAASETRELIKQVATQDKITDRATAKILKDTFDFDVMKAVMLTDAPVSTEEESK